MKIVYFDEVRYDNFETLEHISESDIDAKVITSIAGGFKNAIIGSCSYLEFVEFHTDVGNVLEPDS